MEGNDIDNDSVRNSGVWDPIESFLRKYTFTYNSLYYIKEALRMKWGAENIKGTNKTPAYSGYYDYTNDEFMRARFSIEKIVRMANDSGKSMVLFTIPTYVDFLRYRDDPLLPPLHSDLDMLSKEIGFEYLDLLPFMFKAEKDWGKFFLLVIPIGMMLVTEKLPK